MPYVRSSFDLRASSSLIQNSSDNQPLFWGGFEGQQAQANVFPMNEQVVTSSDGGWILDQSSSSSLTSSFPGSSDLPGNQGVRTYTSSLIDRMVDSSAVRDNLEVREVEELLQPTYSEQNRGTRFSFDSSQIRELLETDTAEAWKSYSSGVGRSFTGTVVWISDSTPELEGGGMSGDSLVDPEEYCRIDNKLSFSFSETMSSEQQQQQQHQPSEEEVVSMELPPTPKASEGGMDTETNGIDTSLLVAVKTPAANPTSDGGVAEDKSANKARRKAGRDKARSFRLKHMETFFRTVFGHEKGERFADFLAAAKTSRNWFEKVGVEGFITHIIGSHKRLKASYDDFFKVVGDEADIKKCEELFHKSVDKDDNTIRDFPEWRRQCFNAALECAPKNSKKVDETRKRQHSADSRGSGANADTASLKPPTKKHLVFVTPRGGVLQGDSKTPAQDRLDQQRAQITPAELKDALAATNQEKEKEGESVTTPDTPLTFQEAILKQAEVETNPLSILVYFQHPTDDNNRVPMFSPAWDKWYDYLTAAVMRYEANAMNEALAANTTPKMIRLAKSGFDTDHGVLVPRDDFSKEFFMDVIPKVGAVKKDKDGNSTMEPGVNGLRVKAWPVVDADGKGMEPTVVLRLYYPDSVLEAGLGMEELLRITLFKSGIHPGSDLAAYNGGHAFYWDKNTPNVLCFKANAALVAAIMSNRNSLERAYGCGSGMLYAGLKVQPVFYKNKRLSHDSKLVYGYYVLPPPMSAKGKPAARK